MNEVIRCHLGTDIYTGKIVFGCADCEFVVVAKYRNYAENPFFDMFVGLAALEILGHSISEHSRPTDDVSGMANWPAS